jgi:Fur family ferric uptake transcriptional regulator
MERTSTQRPIGEQLRDSLRNRGCFLTVQREIVFSEALAHGSHFSIEELARRVARKKRRVSRATVYRTVAHLEQAGLLRKVDFDENHAHYEAVPGREHHEHLVCRECGGVTEFSHAGFERQIARIARAHHFRSTSHRVEIFGVCSACARRGAGGRQRPSRRRGETSVSGRPR